MVKKNYDWEYGATLDGHSKCKHKILREYFHEYLITRCQNPMQSKFRLAIVDGFSGAGKYKCGSYGSPLVFLDVLKNTTREINARRVHNGMRPVEIECYLTFNDLDAEAINQLKQNIAPLEAEIKNEHSHLYIQSTFYNKRFEDVYPEIKSTLQSANYKSVLFNLDQCGYSDVDTASIGDIMATWKAAEVFLTFPIKTIRTYLSLDQTKNKTLLKDPKLLKEMYAALEDKNNVGINKPQWLGAVEVIIFEKFQNLAPFVSPFSINNPKGWRYWLMHFANNYRARQVYNNILHDNSDTQAHFGRAGLDMLLYDPRYDPQFEGQLYLFDGDSRESAKSALYDDIPKLISEHGDAIAVEDFYLDIYNGTAAHSDDIHEMIIENNDIEVITEAGGKRHKANTIKPSDLLRLKQQKVFPVFFKKKK